MNIGVCCHKCAEGKTGPNGVFPLTLSVMIVCKSCGNKRCPKATDHNLACTNSNESGQPGSIYAAPSEPVKGECKCGANPNWELCATPLISDESEYCLECAHHQDCHSVRPAKAQGGQQ